MKARLLFLLLFICLFFSAQQAVGQVKGRCDNCHTMHNSQSGSKMVYMGTSGAAWAGWNGSNVLQGGVASTDPQANLLVSDCVGCHTNSTDNRTIITIGSSRIPIVFNSNVAPENPLAGGNFYWVVKNGDAYGHNVRGISAQDVDLIEGGPGGPACGTENNCHISLTFADTAEGDKNGCQACHQYINKGVNKIGGHHKPSVAPGNPADETEGYYRFVGGPERHDGLGGGGVTGIEDPDWEQTTTASKHNTYWGGLAGVETWEPESMGKFCAGCHYQFHSAGYPNTFFVPVDNGGEVNLTLGSGQNPWFRHPADYAIPKTGEYTSYTDYDPLVPVARQDLTSFTVNKVNNGAEVDKVFCLSCHRAHGSPYPDMLRWNYTLMEPGTTTPGLVGTGCFKCHSDKDE